METQPSKANRDVIIRTRQTAVEVHNIRQGPWGVCHKHCHGFAKGKYAG